MLVWGLCLCLLEGVLAGQYCRQYYNSYSTNYRTYHCSGRCCGSLYSDDCCSTNNGSDSEDDNGTVWSAGVIICVLIVSLIVVCIIAGLAVCASKSCNTQDYSTRVREMPLNRTGDVFTINNTGGNSTVQSHDHPPQPPPYVQASAPPAYTELPGMPNSKY